VTGASITSPSSLRQVSLRRNNEPWKFYVISCSRRAKLANSAAPDAREILRRFIAKGYRRGIPAMGFRHALYRDALREDARAQPH